MKYSFAGFGMIMLGLFAFAIVMVFQFITINNESDYYSLKEAMEASMYEAIDWDYYTGFSNDGKGEIKIIKEKFVANFTRRFVKNTMGNSNGYILEFYDIMEKPPKVSVRIKNKTSSMSISEDDFIVVNELSGILEAKNISMTSTNSGVCPDGKSLSYGVVSKGYHSNMVINKGTNYLMNTNTIKNLILNSPDKPASITGVNDIKSLSISSFKFDGFSTGYKNVNQAANYYAYGSPGNWTEVTSTSSKFQLDASCKPEYVSFKSSVSDGKSEKIGWHKGKPNQIQNEDPIIISVKIMSSDSNVNKECDFGFQYTIYWRYSYCS